MLRKLYINLNVERHKILQQFVNDQKSSTVIKSTHAQFSHCKYVNTIYEFNAKETQSIFTISKNVARCSTNLAIENKEVFGRTRWPRVEADIQLSNEDVENLQNLDWSSISPTEFLTNFKKLSLFMDKEDVKKPEINYENLVEATTVLTPNFSDEEIAYLLKYLQLWLSNTNLPKGTLISILRLLDIECLARHNAKKYDIETMFMFCSLFCNLYYAKKSLFTCKALLRLSQKAKHLTQPQLVKLMYFMTACKYLPVNLYEIEYHLESKMDTLSLEEQITVVTGFFRNDIRIRSTNFLKHIIKTILDNMETMTDQQISIFLRFMNLSYRSEHKIDDLIQKILKALEREVPRLNSRSLTYISSLAARTLIFEEKLMDSILERYDKEITLLTVKDIERMVYSITAFDYDSNHPFYQKTVEEINSSHRQHEYEDHEKSLVHTVKYLAIAKIYPLNLLEKIMDPEFIKKAYASKYAMKDSHYFLDLSIECEVPNYTGPRLSDELRTFCGKRSRPILDNESRVNNRSSILNKIIATCQRILNTESGIYTDKLLPHFRYQDIVICLDQQNNVISPESVLSSMEPIAVKRVPEDAKKYKWLALIVSTNNMLIKDTDEYSGILKARYRQLQQIGYTPKVVLHTVWYKHEGEEGHEKHREDYIKSLLDIK